MKSYNVGSAMEGRGFVFFDMNIILGMQPKPTPHLTLDEIQGNLYRPF